MYSIRSPTGSPHLQRVSINSRSCCSKIRPPPIRSWDMSGLTAATGISNSGWRWDRRLNYNLINYEWSGSQEPCCSTRDPKNTNLFFILPWFTFALLLFGYWRNPRYPTDTIQTWGTVLVQDYNFLGFSSFQLLNFSWGTSKIQWSWFLTDSNRTLYQLQGEIVKEI